MNYYRTPRSTSKCGKSSTGQSCSLGPINGKCGLQGSTADVVPCKPIRTLHWWNNVIRIAFSLLALIIVSFSWGNFSTRRVVTPGPLSLSHAQLLVSKSNGTEPMLAIDANKRCSACHPGADFQVEQENSGLTTATDVSTNQSQAKRTQSQLCLNCHIDAMPDARFGSPHDLTGPALEQLVQRGDRGESKSLLGRFVGHRPIDWESRSTECSQCHREHQGSSHDLQVMTSQRCQACHKEAFESFSNGHPEFSHYPDGAERRIAFDHKRHQDLHYTKKATGFDCKSCHVQNDQLGAVGKVFRSLPFETACASCHSEPLKSTVQDGMIVIQLPSVNRHELSEAGLDIGVWPEQASQINDGTIPIPMRWLLQAEPSGNTLLNSLPQSGRLSEVDMTSPQQRQALANLVGATKNLMSKLANQGQPGFRESIENLIAISPNVDTNERHNVPNQQQWLDQFASGIPPDMFRAAMSEWFMPYSGIRSTTRNQSRDGSNSEITSQAASETAKVWLSSQIQSLDDDLLAEPIENGIDSGDGLLNGDSLLDSSLPKTDNNPSSGPAFRDTKAWDQLSYGGWMIDRQRMAVVYVAKGHADPWISSWIELEKIKNPNVDSTTSIGSISQQCRSCHQLGAISRGSQCWRSERRAANISPITKFDHTPHLSLPSINDCRSCHLLAGSKGDKGHPNEFMPMQKAQCSSCHMANAAGESCTQCHNYHVGNASWR